MSQLKNRLKHRNEQHKHHRHDRKMKRLFMYYNTTCKLSMHMYIFTDRFVLSLLLQSSHPTLVCVSFLHYATSSWSTVSFLVYPRDVSCLNVLGIPTCILTSAQWVRCCDMTSTPFSNSTMHCIVRGDMRLTYAYVATLCILRLSIHLSI